MAKSCAAADRRALEPAQQVLARDVLERLSGKWAIWVLHVLDEAQEPMRFSRVMDAVDGISQKVLTRTLRQLERDGFLSRTVYAQVPPRVEYKLTDLGKDLVIQIAPLFAWVAAEIDTFAAARMKFAARETNEAHQRVQFAGDPDA